MNLLNLHNVWQASNLPDGLTLEDGEISGTPTTSGSYTVPITVINELGTSTKNINIRVKGKDVVTIMQNGAVLETTTFTALQASIQDGTAQSKYNCTNTQMLIDLVHPKTGSFILDVPVNFCDFRTVTLQDGTTKTGLILQFANPLWKGFAPFGTNSFNRWKYSQLRKWLNASGSDWFTSSYTADVLTLHAGSYTDAGVKGFLACLPSALADMLLTIKVTTQAFFDDNNTDTAIDDPDYINGFDADVTYDKVFIPSLSEMGISAGNNENYPEDDFEGTAWTRHSGFTDMNGDPCVLNTRSAVINGTDKIITVDSTLQPIVSDVYNANTATAPTFVLG
ncbi:MAG: putative Ig domain-containing protein [Synergistaceae bacterium]|nr:putative Ig domain-containing protein [Synergistaceae bacterium]